MKVGKQGETHQIVWTWLLLGITLMTLLTWFNGRPEAVGLLHVPWDKMVHGLIFGGLSLIFGMSVGDRRRCWFVFLFMVAFAVFDELRQIYLPGSSKYGKFCYDVLSIIVSLWVVLPWLRHG